MNRTRVSVDLYVAEQMGSLTKNAARDEGVKLKFERLFVKMRKALEMKDLGARFQELEIVRQTLRGKRNLHRVVSEILTIFDSGIADELKDVKGEKNTEEYLFFWTTALERLLAHTLNTN